MVITWAAHYVSHTIGRAGIREKDRLASVAIGSDCLALTALKNAMQPLPAQHCVVGRAGSVRVVERIECDGLHPTSAVYHNEGLRLVAVLVDVDCRTVCRLLLDVVVPQRWNGIPIPGLFPTSTGIHAPDGVSSLRRKTV